MKDSNSESQAPTRSRRFRAVATARGESYHRSLKKIRNKDIID